MTVQTPNNFLPGYRLFAGEDLNAALNYPLVSFEGSITAHAGGGRTNAYQLGARINQVDTSATTGDSVKLPLAVPGMTVVVLNNSASHTVGVYTAGSDTIDGGASTASASLATTSQIVFRCAESGKWISSAQGSSQIQTFGALTATTATFTTVSISGLTNESAAGVSAAGTNQTTATAITSQFNQLTTVGASTGVVLPAAVVGYQLMLGNKGANDVKVYGAGSDTIDGTAGATGVTLGHTAGTNSCMFFCCVAGTWISAKLGAVST